MTIKTRNLFIKAFLISSLILTALMLVAFIFALFSGRSLATTDLRVPAILDRLPFFQNSFIALMISFAVLFLYIPFCFYMVLRFFENTQTSEIIFFTGFLIACMAESARFLSICMGLWLSFSNMLIFAGKVVLFGRTLTSLSFLGAALLSDSSQRQDIERNFIILVTVSVVFAAIIPMNTAKIASTGLVTEGFMGLINMSRLIIFITTILSFLVQGIQKNSFEYKQLAFSSFILIAGYCLLVSCDSFIFLILGTAGLISGTWLYLKYVHKMYMWS